MSKNNNAVSTADKGWMYREVTEMVVVSANICGSYDYARQKLWMARKALNLKRITIKTFADFYQYDVLMFYNPK
jgi:hypothetical protein